MRRFVSYFGKQFNIGDKEVMPNTQETAQQLMSDIQSLEAQLSAKRKELSTLQGDLKSLLAVVTNHSSGNKVSKAGRPRGPSTGPSVSQQVLEALASNENGLTRAELLKLFPDRETAVHAAITAHRVAGKVYNHEHRWYFNTTAPEVTDEVNESVETTEATV